MRGRKPLAGKVHDIRGHLGRRTKNLKEPEPERPRRVPQPPKFLSKDAKNEWRRLAPRLHGLDLLKHEDRAAFTAYCEAWSLFKRATEELQKAGGLVIPVGGSVKETHKRGGDVEVVRKAASYNTHPIISVQRRAAEMMHKFASEFGLSPVARRRLAMTPKTGDEGDWDEF
jgi:P27 family predicted phage terminase small subunit